MRGIDLVERFEKFAPKQIAVEHDPIGLQIGDLNRPVHRVMTTLDVRPEVVVEAIDNHVDFIFAHHPVMFRPAKNLDLTIPQNEMYAQIIKHDITVYAAHTNLDDADGGMNDWLADAVGIQNPVGLVDLGTTENPFSMGRIGDLSAPTTVMELAEKCKQIFDIDGLRLVSNQPDQVVQRVAILGGDGGKFFPVAQTKGAQVYITGDVYYHTGHDMLSAGLNVIDPGHNIEKICIPKLAKLFNAWATENDWSIEVLESKVNTDPYTFI
ncbi:Nif3-like dinuclear metal center hexameric protein [Lactobacillus sp. Sy-1]|uniref:Nif3-like dinuclear metal center hexameric protein n=1 Tax=Lactobacillus sp. Sy-1 TaxID=2109645 RepID=UPI001C55C536|nr:Nif3-like dinuclear metal center hexameric protein [Lactobacillus sp. Sy-1]MBW1605532.1 Nif3-like dinuclear metal center hexameric protein [Lactobacillus sp. Sy-1]